MSQIIPADVNLKNINQTNNEWKNIENQKGYPVPQGNMEMMKYLTRDKQLSLLYAYNEVMKT